jgi:hypothetical protein
MTVIYKLIQVIEYWVCYLFIHKEKIFLIFVAGCLGLLVVEVLCFNYLLNYALCMNDLTCDTTSKFLAKKGSAKVISCDSMLDMLKKFDASETVTIQVPTGEGRFINPTTFEQPVRQFTRVVHHVVDLSDAPYHVQIGSRIFPNMEACTRLEGTLITHVSQKDK